MTLRLIGAGFGRTGTLSLKAALEALGLAPCYHLATVLTQPGRLADWEGVLGRRRRGEPVDWGGVFAGFQAAVDWPGCAYWRELAAAFPDAKVLLLNASLTMLNRLRRPDDDVLRRLTVVG